MALVTLSYPELSALVGAAQIVDAVLLFRRKGRFTRGVFYFSLFEYCWAAVSLWEMTDPESVTPEWLPLSFILWVVVGLVWGLVQRARHAKLEAIPMPAVVIGGAFGCFFLVASVWVSI